MAAANIYALNPNFAFWGQKLRFKGLLNKSPNCRRLWVFKFHSPTFFITFAQI
jgi:hypothetical protein